MLSLEGLSTWAHPAASSTESLAYLRPCPERTPHALHSAQFHFLRGNLSFSPVAAPPNPNREVAGDTIIFRDTQISSRAVYQCNTSNEHGYLLANAFVSVLGEHTLNSRLCPLAGRGVVSPGIERFHEVHILLCSLGILGRLEDLHSTKPNDHRAHSVREAG